MGLHPLLSPPHVPSPCSWLLLLGAAACPGPWRPCHPPQAQCPPALPPLWPPGGEPCRGPHSAARSPAWPCEGWTLPLAAGVGVGRLVPSCPLTGLSVPAFPFLPTLTARHQDRDLPPTSRAEISWPSLLRQTGPCLSTNSGRIESDTSSETPGGTSICCAHLTNQKLRPS